jgi:hypothetical protein
MTNMKLTQALTNLICNSVTECTQDFLHIILHKMDRDNDRSLDQG